MQLTARTSEGFSLIEVLIMVAVLGGLAAAYAGYQSSVQRWNAVSLSMQVHDQLGAMIRNQANLPLGLWKSVTTPGFNASLSPCVLGSGGIGGNSCGPAQTGGAQPFSLLDSTGNLISSGAIFDPVALTWSGTPSYYDLYGQICSGGPTPACPIEVGTSAQAVCPNAFGGGAQSTCDQAWELRISYTIRPYTGAPPDVARLTTLSTPPLPPIETAVNLIMGAGP